MLYSQTSLSKKNGFLAIISIASLNSHYFSNSDVAIMKKKLQKKLKAANWNLFSIIRMPDVAHTYMYCQFGRTRDTLNLRVKNLMSQDHDYCSWQDYCTSWCNDFVHTNVLAQQTFRAKSKLKLYDCQVETFTFYVKVRPILQY